jgi:hypothetical protein
MSDKKKPTEEDDDDAVGGFTRKDYTEYFGFDPCEGDPNPVLADIGDEDFDDPGKKTRTKKAKKSDSNESPTGARTLGKGAKYRKAAKRTK